MKRISSALLLVVASAALIACNRDDKGGPMEKAGREADRGIAQAGKSVEQAGRDMQDAAKGKK